MGNGVNYFFLPSLRANMGFKVLEASFEPFCRLGKAAKERWDDLKDTPLAKKIALWEAFAPDKIVVASGNRLCFTSVRNASQLLAYGYLRPTSTTEASLEAFRVVDLPVILLFTAPHEVWIDPNKDAGFKVVSTIEGLLNSVDANERARLLTAIRWYNKSCSDADEHLRADAILAVVIALEVLLALPTSGNKKQLMEEKLKEIFPARSDAKEHAWIAAFSYQAYETRNLIAHEGLSLIHI